MRFVLAVVLVVCSVVSSPVWAADGFADVNGVTTGGAGGPTVSVSSVADFLAYATQATAPYVIEVTGNLNVGAINIGSNKTIRGAGAGATLEGELQVSGKSNVIFQNLNITNDRTAGTGDGIRIVNGSHHIWADHCTFYDTDDGALDITNESDYVTVSWCKFYYTRNNGHNFVNLIGSSDDFTADRGKLHVTFHHNWWGNLCIERMPRVRFGQVHVYNNYYSATGNNYGVRAALESQNLVENNYFDGTADPWEYYTTNGQTPGLIKAVGNLLVNTNTPVGGNDNVFNPPYNYQLDAAADVKSKVMAGAGAGGGSTPPPPATLPAAPTALSAVAGKRKITLSWTDNSNNETGFKIERSTDGVTFTQIATSTSASYTNGSLTTGATYHYRVRAYNSAGDSTYSNVATATSK
ncbi:MAG TPA: fibronectin type III domain-containing protein [Thermoanaerobaculia bacterium]|jgi:pectate lyase